MKVEARHGKAGVMNLMEGRAEIAGLALLVLGSFVAGVAAQAQAAQNDSGRPARAVRLSYVDGQVRLSQDGEVLSDHAAANTPLFEGAQLTTGDDGKAEIQFEDGSVARLAPDSSLTLTVLRGAGVSADAELSLNKGLAYFEIQGGDQAGQINLRFGSSVAATNGFTALRVDMDTPPGSLAVFSGNVHIEIADGRNGIPIEDDLHGGESIALNADDPTEYELSDSIEPNSWDAWNSDRDEALTAEAADQTAAPADIGESDNPAWNDLDANGSWYNVPGQGDVWSPYEAQNSGFDPYGNGDWVDTPSYGYIWVSGYPWGYLPFQCGSWNYYGGFGWGWSPGAGNPWWKRGGYGGPNIGLVPHGYQPVRRPLPPRNSIAHRPMPMVTVNRSTLLARTNLPTRDTNMPVTIAGSTVQPFRPLPSRPVYAQGFAAVGNRPVPGVNRPAASGWQNSSHAGYMSERSAGVTIMRPAYTPQPRPMAENRSYAPALAPSWNYASRRSWNRGSNSSTSGHSGRSSGGGFHSSGGGFHSSGGGFHSSGGGWQGGGGGFHGGGGSYGGGGGGHH